MSPKASIKTLRVQGIPPGVTLKDFQDSFGPGTAHQKQKQNLFKKISTSRVERPWTQPICSLASQYDGTQTGTVSFSSEDTKCSELEKIIQGGLGGGWFGDDLFHGITILSAVNDAELDVCAVHGLGGHAFDTWTNESSMWLRDILPESIPFNRSRVLSFGYDSSLFNRQSLNRIQDWADELLRQLGYLRTSAEERQRPVILICHSLVRSLEAAAMSVLTLSEKGGLVAREAMIRLHRYGQEYEGIQLDQCGLLFLATPHSGTTEADWNEVLLSLSEAMLGVRNHAIIEQLKSFSDLSVDSQKAFASMSKVPPFFCLCEGKRTNVLGKRRIIVTQASAGFCGRTAEMMLNVDHHGICKFETRFTPEYMNVLSKLTTLRKSLLMPDGQDTAEMERPVHVSGRPSITAPHFPLPRDKKFYEGIYSTHRLVGRTSTLERLHHSLKGNKQASRFIALTGMGGIGKTEILLEVALRFRDFYNVFFVKANDRESLESALYNMANSIGHDILTTRYPDQDLAFIWRTFSAQEKVLAFKKWLGSPEAQPNVFIVDDIDGLMSDELIAATLLQPATNILYSARDPSIMQELGRDCQSYHIPVMLHHEIVSLMEAVLKRDENNDYTDLLSKEGLSNIADIMHGHALGACRALSYILNVGSQTSDEPLAEFVKMYKGSDWQARRDFLNYEPRLVPSIMTTFTVSIDRISQHQRSVLKLLELIGFLNGPQEPLHFRYFLGLHRPWLEDLQPLLPDYEVFARGIKGQGQYLSELERVSLGVRAKASDPLEFHPLWIECILQRAEASSRIRWLKQILLLCHASFERGTASDLELLRPFVINAREIAARFAISLDEIATTQEVKDCIEIVASQVELPAPKPPTTSTAKPRIRNDQPAAIQKVNADNSELATRISDLVRRCETAAHNINPVNTGTMSEESFETLLQLFIKLLQALKDLNETYGREMISIPAFHAQHLTIYELLIQMAPKFRRRNAQLVKMLEGQRRDWIAKVAERGSGR